MRKTLVLLTLVVTVALLSTAGWSQAVSGDIIGTVSDTTGAVVPNTTITALNTATNFKTTTVSNSVGAYRFTNLPVGSYKISSTAPGYALTTADTVVELNKTNTLPLVLHVGKVETVVEVSGTAATVDTSTATISNTFTAKLAENLPEASTGSGVMNLSLLAPGVTNASAMGYGSGPSVGGQRPTNNSFELEGVDNNYRGVTGWVTTVPNDAVAEFTMLQNQFSPEFGHSSGGNFNIIVKSGTNALHGKAYEYFQNRDLNALDPSLRNQGLDYVPRYDNNRFGGSLGGPIIKDKLFFFGLAEYNPIGLANPSSTSICVPSAAGFATLNGLAGQGAISTTNLGVFSQYTAGLPTSPGCGTKASTQNTTVAGVPIPLATVSIVAPRWTNYLNTVGSIDYNISGNDQLRGRWIYNKADQIISDGANLPVFFSTYAQRAHTIAISEFHTFSPTLANEFRFGFSRLIQAYPIGDYSFPGLGNFPTFTFDDLNTLQIGPNGNFPQASSQNSYQISDSITWTKGRHTFKFGGDVMRAISPSDFVQYLRPSYEYSALDLYMRDISPDVVALRGFTSGSGIYWGNNWSFSFYGNDQMKVTKNLTLNLGLRYEYSTLPAGAAQQTLNSMNNVPGLITFGKPKMPTKNFMPRIGFAYSPGSSGTTSIRGGFGLTYDIVFDNLLQNSLPQQFQYTTGPALTAAIPKFLQNGGITSAGSAPTDRSLTSSLIPNVLDSPYTINWNLGVQHVIGNVWTIDAEYVGNHSLHLPLQTRINVISPVSADRYLPTYLQAPTPAALDALTLTLADLQAAPANYPAGVPNYLDPRYVAEGFTNPGGITSTIAAGNSYYNAFDLSLKRRFFNGLQLAASWTWSHNLSNSDAMLYSTSLNPRRPQDFRNLAAEKANSLLDRRHRIVLQAVYDLPFFQKSGNGFLKHVAAGWELVPTWVFESPQYVTVQSGQDANLNGDAAADRVVYNMFGLSGVGSGVSPLCNSGLAAAITAGTLPTGTLCGASADDGSWNTDAYIVGYQADNPNAMYVVAAPGALATLGRNTMTVPRTNNVNMAVSKTFRFTERMNFQVMAQAFNIFNHPQFVTANLYDAGLNNNLTNYRSFVLADNANFARPNQVFSGNSRAMVLSFKFNF